MYDLLTHEPMTRLGGRQSGTAPPLAHVQSGGEAEILARIHAAEVNLAIWERRLAAHVACEAVKLVVAGEGDVRLRCKAEAVLGSLDAALQAQGWPHAPWLCADVAALAGRFAAIMASPILSLRLEIVTGDACRKFHADYVTARLISSYTGPGSEWLGDDVAAALAAGQVLKPRDIRRLAVGDVALCKGRRWSDTPIIHRSPPIAGTGQRRLVLVINPATGDD